MNKKIDSLYAALMLIEILYERGLINKATLDAEREKVKSENPHNSPAAKSMQNVELIVTYTLMSNILKNTRRNFYDKHNF